MKMPLALFALILISLNPIYAKDKPKDPKNNATIHITTRTETDAGDTGGNSVSVITAKDIRVNKAVSLIQILRNISGIQAADNGGAGSRGSLFFRGMDSKDVLILLDGVPLNDPSDTNNTRRVDVGLTGGTNRLTYNLNVINIDSDGFSSANSESNQLPNDGNNLEDDAYNSVTVSGRIEYDMNETIRVWVGGREIKDDKEFDDVNFNNGYPGDRFDTDPLTYEQTANPNGQFDQGTEKELTFLNAGVETIHLDGDLVSILSLSRGEKVRDTFDNDNVLQYDYEGKQERVSWIGAYHYNKNHDLSVGVDYDKTQMQSDFASIAMKLYKKYISPRPLKIYGWKFTNYCWSEI